MLGALKKAKQAFADFWRPVAFTQTLADVPDRMERQRNQRHADRAQAQRQLVLRPPDENSPLLRHARHGAAQATERHHTPAMADGSAICWPELGYSIDCIGAQTRKP